MGVLASRIARLRDDLRRVLDGDSPAGDPLPALADQIATALLRALGDRAHPIHQKLSALLERVEAARTGTLHQPLDDTANGQRRKPRYPHLHLFLSHPGVTAHENRKHWRLQLLLQIAIRSAKRNALAERLGLDPDMLLHAAIEAAGSSVATWSARQLLEYLQEAIEILDYPDPPLPVSLDGRYLQSLDGERLRLSPQEAAFLRLLIDRHGGPASYREMADVGINNPPRIKSALVKKLRLIGITLPITASPGAYRLHA